MEYKYKKTVIGGTFDHLHIGHKKLIDNAFENSEHVFIGIATSALYKDKYLSHVIEDLKSRRESLIKYLKEKSYFDRAEIIEINDMYGNTLTEENINAIFATIDTLENVNNINSKRQELGLVVLEIIKVEHVLGKDGNIVSSEAIRRGEVDRDGNTYFELFKDKKRYWLPEEMRPMLRKPFGKVVRNIKIILKSIDERDMLIAIGDMVTIELFKSQNQADISIFDYKTQREGIGKVDQEILQKLSKNIERVENSPGIIERRAVGVIRKAFINFQESREKQSILVDGEEDLLAIPAILLAPLGTLVVYGQKDKGAVAVRVTERKKVEVMHIFEKFS